MFTRPVWVEISGRCLVENYRRLRALAGDDADLLTVVKANAYGHGVLECAPLLVAAGAEWLGVTSVEEGVRVRAVCPRARVLVMSGVWHGEAEAAIEYQLTPVVWEPYQLDLLESAAAQRGINPHGLAVHVEIDTGMSRQGVRVMGPGPEGVAELLRLLERFDRRSPLRVESLMTHFSAPEVLDDSATSEQLARFQVALARLVIHGRHPHWISAGNSATMLAGADTARLKALGNGVGARLLLRPGLALYGYAPRLEGGVSGEADPLKPVLALKTRVTSLRTIETEEGVGYNSTFRAGRPTRLALLPCGYADGVSRLLSNRGSVLIRGRHAPIVGRVSMDQTIVDVTDIAGIEVGDEVVLIGTQGEAAITAYDVADQMGTIPYEVLCGISLRVPHVVVD